MFAQSESFPGNPPNENAFFRRTKSLALFAASLAFAESNAFPVILFATFGFSSKNSVRNKLTAESTSPLTSELPNFVFV